MVINSIEIKNFRNIENQIVELAPNFNKITGMNGSGKTSILEAIYFVLNLTSFRSSKKATIAKNQLYVKLTLVIDTNEKIDILYNKNIIKVFINNEPIDNYQLLAKFNKIIFFNPVDFNILLGPVLARRKMLNSNIGQINPNYLVLLQEIKKLKTEKLKQINSLSKEKLIEYNELLLSKYISIYKSRENYVEQLNSSCNKKMKWKMIYSRPKLDVMKITNEEFKYKKNKFNMDIDKLTISVNDVEVKTFASRGQLKRILLEICYGHMVLFENEINEKVVILVDDLHAEFDKYNINEVLELFNKNQVIYTKIESTQKIQISYET